MIYQGKFGGIPSASSRDIMGTRICHTYPTPTPTPTPTGSALNPIRPPSPLLGGHNSGLDFIKVNILTKFHEDLIKLVGWLVGCFWA